MSGSATAERKRVAWVDVARGSGILLVVFGHVWRNAGADRLIAPGLFSSVDNAIYLFHMPLFFFLSGLFLSPRLARGGLAFIRSRPAAILAPLFFWAFITAALRFVVGQHMGLWDFIAIPFDPLSIFWFLWALLSCQLIAAALLLSPSPRLAVSLAAVVAAAAFSLSPLDNLGLADVLKNLPFYLLGVLIPAARVPASWSAALIGAVAVAAAEFILPVTSVSVGRYALAFVATGGAVMVCAGLSEAGPQSWLGRGLIVLGRASMAIYLMHIIFIGVHLALLKFGIAHLGAQLALLTAIGIVGPLIALQVIRRLRLGVLVGGTA